MDYLTQITKLKACLNILKIEEMKLKIISSKSINEEIKQKLDHKNKVNLQKVITSDTNMIGIREW